VLKDGAADQPTSRRGRLSRRRRPRTRWNVARAKWQPSEAALEPAPSLAIAERLAKADPGNADWQHDLSVNLTGINIFAAELVAKRLQLLREMVPAAARVAVLVDPASTTITEATLRDVEPAARAMGLQIQVLHASNSREISAAFATFVRERPDALFVSIGPLFTARRVQLATLAARHMVPMTSANRQNTEAGGLMSYGANIVGAYHQMGIYVGRILKGEKPVDLPVVQSSKFELVINAETAQMLGLMVPPSLLAIADEVIE
jgi:putative ABC transport system substrate-binding protein